MKVFILLCCASSLVSFIFACQWASSIDMYAREYVPAIPWPVATSIIWNICMSHALDTRPNTIRLYAPSSKELFRCTGKTPVHLICTPVNFAITTITVVVATHRPILIVAVKPTDTYAATVAVFDYIEHTLNYDRQPIPRHVHPQAIVSHLFIPRNPLKVIPLVT